MSKFSGPQGSGAMKHYREKKRSEADERHQKAILAAHPDGVCNCKPGNAARRHDQKPPNIVQDIFGNGEGDG